MTRVPISLSDGQLQAVMTAAASLPPEKRTTFLERVAGTLARPDAKQAHVFEVLGKGGRVFAMFKRLDRDDLSPWRSPRASSSTGAMWGARPGPAAVAGEFCGPGAARDATGIPTGRLSTRQDQAGCRGRCGRRNPVKSGLLG